MCVISYWIDTLVLKLREILTLLYCITLYSSRENQRSAQEVARRISGAVAGEIYAQVKTCQVPITNSYPSHYIICHFPLVFLSPTSPLPFYSLSLSLFASFARLPFCLLFAMASLISSPLSPENEVINFKQREGEHLKDAWYRICNAQNGSTRK